MSFNNPKRLFSPLFLIELGNSEHIWFLPSAYPLLRYNSFYSDKIFPVEYPSDPVTLQKTASWLIYIKPNQNIWPVPSSLGSAYPIKLVIIMDVTIYII